MNSITQQFVTDTKGKKTAVMIPIDQYYELMEDLHDLAKIAERKDEGTISLAEVNKKLKTKCQQTIKMKFLN